jgi:gliding motility-associated-like protein
MHLTKNKVITLLIALMFSVAGFSQVPSGPFRINEYSCANVSGLSPSFPGGTTPDWFEIYNNTLSPKDISGWYVSNDPNYIAKWQFPINTIIPDTGYLIVFADGLDTAFTSPAPEYHTNFDLLQTMPQRIILCDGNGVVKDSVTIRRHKPNHSWARVTNGSANWRVFACNPQTGAPTWTPGAKNPPASGTGARKSFRGYLAPPLVDPPRGFFPQGGNVQVTLSIPPSASGSPYLNMYYLGAPGNGFTGNLPHPGFDPSAFTNIDYNPPYDQSILGQYPIANLYDGTAISIDSSTVLRFFLDTADIQLNPGPPSQYLPSFVETHSYILDQANILKNATAGTMVNTGFTLPTVSVAFDSTTSGSSIGGPGTVPHDYKVTIEYFDKNKNFKFTTAGTAVIGSGDDAQIPGLYQGFNYSANDELGYNYTNKQQLYTNSTLAASGRTEQTNISFKAAGSDNFPITQINTYTSTNEMSVHFRDPLCQTYAMKNNLRLDGLHYQPCIMYVNGQYFGIFDIREVFDDEYTKYYYGTDSDSIQACLYDGALFTAGPNTANDWNALVNYIISNDMRVDANRHVADSLLDFNSLIDLVIYNGYVVNTGFPQKAAWWRGPDLASHHIKWHYLMYDMEDSYGLGENDALLPSTLSNASVCQAEQSYSDTVPPVNSGNDHLGIFTALMQSDTFKSQFINRYSYLLNNSLRCPPIIAHVNYLRGLLAPEILQHATNVSYFNPPLPHALDTMWSLNVDTMVYWINQRCPTITEDIKTCYNVNGPWRFCTDVEPAGAGTVYLNTVGYPEEHSDMYFGNVWFDAIGSPTENYYFDHWELESFVLPDSMLRNDSLHWMFDTSSCITAVFKLKPPYLTTGEPAVPTGFSPNGDGNNDLLNVYGTMDVVDYNFQVYSRWGQKLWESSDKTKGWDGTFKGQEAPVGVYAYVFKLTTSDGKQVQKSGNITLIR